MEDQHLVRQGLKMIIEQDPRLKVAAEAENGEEAVRQFEKHLIDITLMDIRMPVLSGLWRRSGESGRAVPTPKSWC